MSKTMHMCLDVRGALMWPNSKLKHLFVNNETGKKLTATEAKEHLMQKLSEGWEVLPLGKMCEGFDKKTGCPGHEEKKGGQK